MTEPSVGVESYVAVFVAVVSIVSLFFSSKEGKREGNSIANDIDTTITTTAVGAGLIDREYSKIVIECLTDISTKLDTLIDVTEAKGENERAQHLREDLKGDLEAIIRGMNRMENGKPK